jgi:predicted PurR-regulated permease PerM
MLERLVLPLWLRLSLALPLLALNLWVLRQLLLPLAPFPALFVTAALIAFLLDLPTRWWVRRGLPRQLAVLVVVGAGLALLVLAALWLLPRLVEQLGELVAALPGWLAQGEQWLDRLETWAADRHLPTEFTDLSSTLFARASQLASQLSQRLLGILGATVGITVNTVIVAVLAVFLLLGGEGIVAGLARWLPEGVRELVVTTLGRTFRGYFAGHVLFAVAIGFTTLVPYASALTIVLVSLLLALEDPRTGVEVLVAAISVGQVVDQGIQPRLMGSIVGLQPAWLLVSLPIGSRVGSLMGFGDLLGLLLAVPVASCLKTFFDAWAQQRGLSQPAE